ncbi:nucleotide-binding universal stress UspA family protein [Paraburkholderia sp. GAS41]|jgi:nucleotide-binding universal stress UspA family protein|uniref:universal stress protein n=1 Tax=Paraburkholderia sp. GAS41 TaxID=3035134 RepID=UPI003D1E4ED1
MFTKILVAVSANSSDTVMASAIEVARKYDAHIVALHVVDPTPCFLGPLDADVGLIVEAMEANGRTIATRMANMLDEHAHTADARMVTLPLSGVTIGSAIASFANEVDADLIVLGDRKSGWMRWMSQDVAADVRRHSSTPIQIVTGKPTGGQTQRAGARWTDAKVTSAR